MPDIRTALRRSAPVLRWAICTAVVLFGLKYCFEAKDRIRAEKHPDEWWSEVSPVLEGAYTARLVFTSRSTILLRLYRTGEPTVLAERTYKEAGVALRWSEDELVYDIADESFLGGGIQLPPTRLDRLLATLP
jgi:hypothetical protein